MRNIVNFASSLDLDTLILLIASARLFQLDFANECIASGDSTALTNLIPNCYNSEERGLEALQKN
jgi:hypothetical protein